MTARSDIDGPVEVVDGEVIFDPETGWVNDGFALTWEQAVRQGSNRDLMLASVLAIPVPNLDDPR